MSSVQDHAPVDVHQLPETRDPHLTQPEQSPLNPPQVSQKTPVPSDPPQEITGSPPRFSRLLEPQPGPPKSPNRGISSGTDSVTLANHPGIIATSNNDLGAQNNSVPTPERTPNQHYSTSVPDRPLPVVVHDQVPLSDEGDHGRGTSIRPVSIPRPRPVFIQDGHDNRNEPRALGPPSSGDLYSQDPHEPVRLVLTENITCSSLAQLAKTVEARIGPTLVAAEKKLDKYKKKGTSQFPERWHHVYLSHYFRRTSRRHTNQWCHWAPSHRWCNYHRGCRWLEKCNLLNHIKKKTKVLTL